LPARRRTIAFFIGLGAGLISVILFLYIGWVLLNWRTGIVLFLGVLLLAIVLSGVMLNTLFLVREIRRNEQYDAFINAVTHELKTPVPSIRLYLETLQTHGDGRSLKPGELTFYVDQTDGIASPSRRWSLTRESQKLPCVTIRNARCVSDAARPSAD
jgi:signal transduction histidine kinase